MDAAVRYADDRIAVATVGRVIICVLRQPLTIDGITVLRRESRRLQEVHGGLHASLSLIEPGAATSVPPDVREASSAFAREFALLGAAIVVEGTGFRPAAIRTLIAGMYLVIKKRYPHKIVATAEEGVAWLVEQMKAGGVKQDAAELLSTARHAREALRMPVAV